MKEILYKEESYRIMRACFRVHNSMGSGFLEAVYQECLGFEFAAQGIPFVEQQVLPLHYGGHRLKQTYKADFVCYESILIEIKAVNSLANDHRAQVLNYLNATGLHLGLLINFGHHPKLESERIAFSRSPTSPTDVSL